MGMMKNYLLTLLQQCSEEQFGQDVIEWAITTGAVRLSYDLDTDIRAIMSRYDNLIEGYRASLVQLSNAARQAAAPMKRAGSRRGTAERSATAVKRRSVG